MLHLLLQLRLLFLRALDVCYKMRYILEMRSHYFSSTTLSKLDLRYKKNATISTKVKPLTDHTIRFRCGAGLRRVKVSSSIPQFLVDGGCLVLSGDPKM